MKKITKKTQEIDGLHTYYDDGSITVKDRFNNLKEYDSFEDYTNKNKFDHKTSLEKAIASIEKQFGKKSNPKKLDMSYDEWLNHQSYFTKLTDDASAKLNEIVGESRGAFGLTPDSVKFSPEYIKAKAEFDIAFKMQREFNQASPKEFQRRASQERRAKLLNKKTNPKKKKELTFNDFVDMSVNWKGESKEFDCDIVLRDDEEGIDCHAYTCSVSNRDLLFFCDNGTLNFLVDSYGGRNIAELFSADLDE